MQISLFNIAEWRSPGSTALVAGVVAAAFCVVSPGVGHAQDARVGELVRQAGEARKARDHDEAVRLLLAAYEIYPDPTLLFNAAKVFQDGGKCANALKYFVQTADITDGRPDEFLKLREVVFKEILDFKCAEQAPFDVLSASYNVTPNPVVALALARRHEADDRCVEARESYAAVTRSIRASDPHKAEARTALARLECPGGVVEPDPPATARTGTPTLRWVSYGLLGAGALTLIGGVVVDQGTVADIDTYRNDISPEFYEKCAIVSDLRSDPTCKEVFERANALESDIESGQLLTVLAYSGAGLMLAGGAALLYLSYDEPASSSEATTWRVAPMLSPDLVGGTLSLTFE